MSENKERRTARIQMSVHMSIHMSAHVLTHMSTHMLTRMSIHMFAHMSIHMLTHISDVHKYNSMNLSLSHFHMPLHMSMRMSTHARSMLGALLCASCQRCLGPARRLAQLL